MIVHSLRCKAEINSDFRTHAPATQPSSGPRYVFVHCEPGHSNASWDTGEAGIARENGMEPDLAQRRFDARMLWGAIAISMAAATLLFAVIANSPL
jgi:hypothetical protein